MPEQKYQLEYIPRLKSLILGKLKDLTDKIETEEPFPHGNITFESLSDIDTRIEEILNNWNY